MAKAKAKAKPVKKFWQKKKAEPKVEAPIENKCETEGCTNTIAPGQTHVCVAHQRNH